MKKIIIALYFTIQATALLAQNTKSPFNDAAIDTTLQKIKDNIDDLFYSFKSDAQPDANVNFDDAYFTNMKLYNVSGYVSKTDFDNSLSFSIESDDFPDATKADFEQAYETLNEKLRALFDDLEVRDESAAQTKNLTLFEMGKDTQAPVISANSPRYYISLKYEASEEDGNTSWSLFVYFMSKK